VVPGILRTAEYAHATLSYSLALHGRQEDVDAEGPGRMERVRYFYDQAKRFDLLFTENVLLAGPAAAEAMVVQLDFHGSFRVWPPAIRSLS
jgi:hypothetical protein